MSGQQTSTFGDPNILLQTLSGAQTAAVQRNQLLNQLGQQEVAANNTEVVARAASTLLDPTLYPTEEARAAAWPGIIGQLKANGYAPNAPEAYPGEEHLRATAQLGISTKDRYQLGLTTPLGFTADLAASNAPLPGEPGYGASRGGGTGGTTTPGGAGAIGGADTAPINAAGDSRTRKAAEGGPPAPGTPGAATAKQVHDFWISKGLSEEQVAGILAGGPGSESNFIPTASGDGGTSIGLYQHHGTRLHNAQGTGMLDRYGPNPTADQQNEYAAWEISPQGPLAHVGEMLKTAKTAAEAAAIWTQYFGVPADKTEIGRRAAGAQRFMGLYGQPQQGGPGGATATVATPGVQMGGAVPPPPGGAPGAYPGQGAGMGAVVGQGVRPNIGGPQLTVTPPPAIRAQPIPAGRTAAADAIQAGIQQAQATPLAGTQVAGPPMVASTQPTAPVAAEDLTPTPARYAGTAPAPSVEASPETGWGSQVGSGYGPQNTLAPTAVQPPAPAVAAATPAQPPPAATPPVATGVNSPQFRAAVELTNRAAALEAKYPYLPAAKIQAAALRARAQLLMQADSVTVDPVTGIQTRAISGQQIDPAKPLADYQETSPGSGIWVGGPGTEPRFQPPGRLVVTPGGDVYQTTSGGPRLLKRTDPQAVAALEEAKASGAATGTTVAKQLPELMATARNAAAQEGQIDYASNQLREAAKGGVPSGYFSPALATAAAAAKSLGIDTRPLGIDPEAVGNVQTAQKTLSVIGGAILRQALGPGSAITEGKIEQFIHTQPGIETDPQALQRIMAWARSQYTYERELGHAAVSEAAKPENAGRLPPHWLPAYYRDHGFAPIYDPGTQEMRQPDGTQPQRETPPAQPSQAAQPAAALPPAAASRLKPNVVTTFSNGQQWTLRNGQPVQVK